MKVELDIEDILSDAVYLRTMLQRVSSGQPMSIVSGSREEQVIERALMFVDARLNKHLNIPPAHRSPRTTKLSEREKLTAKKNKRARQLIERYFSIHGKE